MATRTDVPRPSTPRPSAAAERSLTHKRLPKRFAPAATTIAVCAVAGLMLLGGPGADGGRPWGRVIAVSLVGGLLLGTLVTWLAARSVEGRRQATDRLVTGLVVTAFAAAMLPLVSLILTVVQNGLARLDAAFFTSDMRNVVGEGGGALHAILGTLIITALATLISVPIGLMCAIYLVEYGGKSRLARQVTFLVDVMTGIPSIVAGLFAVGLFITITGDPGIRNGFIGSVALSVLMIPTVIRSAEEMLKLVPNELREASYALGVPKYRTILRVVIPTALAGIVTGTMLAIARVIGETAPLLVTAGATDSVNTNPFEGRMLALPNYVYYQYQSPGVPPQFSYDRAWTGALTLMAIVMGLNLIARAISAKFSVKTR